VADVRVSRSWRPILLAALVCAVSACSGGRTVDSTSSTFVGPSGTITIAAASSLTDAFKAIGARFEESNQDATLTFAFDASSTLASQIIDGAPADVFASADEQNMTRLMDAGRVEGVPVVIARNDLVIVTQPGNPNGVTDLADLADIGVVALCGADAPCGVLAQQVLGSAGVTIPASRITRGQNARATLTAVSEGDAAAGIVYRTDARSAGDAVTTVVIPEDQNRSSSYQLAVVAASPNATLARSFIAYVVGSTGHGLLDDHGFSPP
jgi:molybdate transport system substrate-binding protein